MDSTESVTITLVEYEYGWCVLQDDEHEYVGWGCGWLWAMVVADGSLQGLAPMDAGHSILEEWWEANPQEPGSKCAEVV